LTTEIFTEGTEVFVEKEVRAKRVSHKSTKLIQKIRSPVAGEEVDREYFFIALTFFDYLCWLTTAKQKFNFDNEKAPMSLPGLLVIDKL